MMNQRIVWRVGLFILLLINTTTGLAASFSAKMVQTKSGETQSVPFYFDDGRYRYEAKQDGRPLIILVDRNSKKTRILVPDEKLYLEIGNDDMESLMNNPYEAIRVMAGTNDVSVAGTERVQDVACDRQEISVNGKPVMTAWIAKSYGFPIKIRNEHNGDLVELVEIDPRNPDPTLFQVPAGFRLAEKMPVAPPAWADDVAEDEPDAAPR